MQLILTIHDKTNAIQSSLIHIVILDFAKVFDKVPHKHLLKKLHYYGINGLLFKWLKSFLTQSLQSVVCKGQSSKPSPVISGVPQGTELCPLLLSLNINDLPDSVQSSAGLFAAPYHQ